MRQIQAPKAFISHAGEDKDVFAKPLARRLRELGVEAWLDEWEIKPGDSLVTKIFHEAMAQSDAVVVVLSKTSVAKPWVKKELDVAVVRNIQKLSRLIPVRIDDCEVPEALRDQLWVDWISLGGVDGVANRLSETLFEHDSRPAFGPPPAYLRNVKLEVPGLTKKDALLLQCLFEWALDNDRRIIQAGNVIHLAKDKGLSEEDALESAEVLACQGFVFSKLRAVRQRSFVVELPSKLMLEIATTYGCDIEALRRRVGALVINQQVNTLSGLVARTGDSSGLIEAVLDEFEGVGFLKLSRALGGHVTIGGVTAPFKRWLADRG